MTPRDGVGAGAWAQAVEQLVRTMGGWCNAHTHLDRANTFAPEFLQHANIDPMGAAGLSLRVKQILVGELHKGPAYQPDNLYARMRAELERMEAAGVREVISFIDATPDIGLVAIHQAARLRDEFRGRLTFKIAVSPIFGFKNPALNPDRWETYRQAAEIADVLGGLPVKDRAEGRVGFDGHVRMVLELAHRLRKPVHFQVDQDNDPREDETEQLVQAVRWLGAPEVPDEVGPTVWAVHAISPSCYEEARFQRLVENLVRYNVGVICCPTAALSMFQLRPLLAPVHNSIARILEMLVAGVTVRIGTDNIGDIFLPNGDGSVRSEVWVAATALRFYHTVVWAKLGAGVPLNEGDKEWIRQALQRAGDAWTALDAHLAAGVARPAAAPARDSGVLAARR
ncbi:MAG: amidohydrolase family protein [Firmicutes bacterium]|nr:amidohydrolase family protein [Bacillota bacterium]